MVESRPLANFTAHLVLWIGIAVVGFPVYLTFVASTYDATTIANGNMPLIPGPNFFKNYYQALFVGTSGTVRTPVSPQPSLLAAPSATVPLDVWLYQLTWSLLTDGNATRGDALKSAKRVPPHASPPAPTNSQRLPASRAASSRA